MPCYKPLSAFRQLNPEDGTRTIVFGREHLKNYDISQPLDLPCGQCIGCRLERSRRWAVRIMHESKEHKANSFLTLTYDEKNLPKNGSLNVEDFQKFMKRLRRGSDGPLRFFHCGEYGETSERPHYHACLFGEDFSADRIPWKKTPQGGMLYISQKLTETWGLGHALIGDLSFESAAYVARYCLKKATIIGEYQRHPDPLIRDKYSYLAAKRNAYADFLDGRKPEYVTMSRRPGIGAAWLQKNRAEVYDNRSDSVVMRGKEMMPPPFYDKLLEKVDPELFKEIKKERVRASQDFAQSEDSTSRRLMDAEKVKNETIKHTLRRSV